MEAPYSNYGYELYLPNVMRTFAMKIWNLQLHETDQLLPKISPPFYEAAWELCRRGILRPGLKHYGAQATEGGGSGDGYSVTPLGREWLEKAEYDYVPVEPTRFAKLLDNFTPRFGRGFQERCMEAIRSYGAQAFLACCAMCGAAAESILIALAIAKKGDEGAIIKMYLTSGGRGKVENVLLSGKPEQLQREFRGFTSLLKYWRDIASHGRAAGISDNEAYTSLALLLRFAQFGNDRWDELTST